VKDGEREIKRGKREEKHQSRACVVFKKKNVEEPSEEIQRIRKFSHDTTDSGERKPHGKSCKEVGDPLAGT